LSAHDIEYETGVWAECPDCDDIVYSETEPEEPQVPDAS